MIKHEAKFVSELQKWCRYNMKGTYCWEAKICTSDCLNYKHHFPEHQVRNLSMCGSHFIYKISDMDRMQKPFDGVSIAEAPGYYFVKFIKPRQKTFYIIEVSAIQKEINKGIKSLTEGRAEEIAWRVGELK